MAKIVIKDLTESVDLDRQAMMAITGGARTGVRPTFLANASGSTRILNYPGSLARSPLGTVRSAGETPRK